MLIKALLHTTYDKLISIRTELSVTVKKKMKRQGDQAIVLEAEKTLSKLENLFYRYGHKKASITTLKPFTTLLKTRWDYVQGTPFSYTHASTHDFSLITDLCEVLATELSTSSFSPHCKIKLLMPSIITQNEVRLTDLDEEQASLPTEDRLQLHQFVLSEDNKHIIEVFECLTDAKEDGTLKHTSALLNNKVKLLNESEKQEVIQHSSRTKNYHKLLQELFHLKNHGENIGAAVNRLITKLNQGGMHGHRGGTNDVAGQDALIGIKDFFNYLLALEEDEKEYLFGCFATNNVIAMSFEVCWLHLLFRAALVHQVIELSEIEVHAIFETLSSSVSDPSIAIACVELIAKDLNNILNNHQELFDMYPRNIESAAYTAVTIKEAAINNAKQALQTALTSTDTYLVLPSSSKENPERLQKQFYNSLINDIDTLNKVLTGMNYQEHYSLFHHILGRKTLQDIINNATSLQKILANCLVVDTHIVLLQALGKDYLQTILPNAKEIRKIIDVLSHMQYSTFFNDILGKDFLKSILSNPNSINTLFTGLSTQPYQTMKKILPIQAIAYSSQNNSSSSSFKFFSDPEELANKAKRRLKADKPVSNNKRQKI
jgi:hypothetical protein